ncbi:hypothetical protein Esti_002234 [Eimeria stiedai]
MLSEAAADFEGLQEENEAGRTRSALDPPTSAQHVSEFEDRAIELPQTEVPLPASEVPLPSEEETGGMQQPEPEKTEQAESKQPKRGVAGAAADEEGEDKQRKLVEAVSASPTTVKREEMIVGSFEVMLFGGRPEVLSPCFLRDIQEAAKQLNSSLAKNNAALEGGGEKDNELRQRRRRWTLYKMQMATLANMEIETREQLDQLSQRQDDEKAVRETKTKLQEIYQRQMDLAALWMKVATEGGMHPIP